MTTAVLIGHAIEASLGLMVVSIGMRARPRDLTYLLRHRGLALRSIVAMNAIMPLVALWVAVMFDLQPAVKLALVGLSIAPAPPHLAGKARESGGDSSYAVGLSTFAAALSIVLVPLTFALIGHWLGADLHVPPLAIAERIGNSVLLPLAVGAGLRWLLPSLAERAVRPLSRMSTVVLLIALLPLLVTAWPAMWSLVGNGTLAAIVVMTAVALAVGHALGGPYRDDRTVLALATASRHPAVAVTAAKLAFPNETLVGPAVLVALIVSALATRPYARWSKRVVRPPVVPAGRAPAAHRGRV